MAEGATGGASVARGVAPGLHFVATPIGAARDITFRALDILGAADLLVAEDTRTLRHLMEIHGVPLRGRAVLAYHDHNGPAMRPRILRALAEGKSVAYASEAGTPLVADPGYALARAAIEAGHPVLAAPGASAVLCALMVAGLPTDRFLFAGFSPPTSGARQRFLADCAAVPATLVFYESPKRLARMLADAVGVFGADRAAVVCRELTKRFEEVRRDTLGALADFHATREVRGEIVVLIDRDRTDRTDPAGIDAALRSALANLTVKDAASAVAKTFGMPRRDMYQRALEIAEGAEGVRKELGIVRDADENEE